MVESLCLVATKTLKTQDEHQLRLGTKIPTESLDFTLTFGDEIGGQRHFQTGERARSFEAVVTLVYPAKGAVLVFHDDHPKLSQAIKDKDACFCIPPTVISGFWLREKESTKKALINAAFDQFLSPEVGKLLRPALDSVTNIATKCFATINLDDLAERKSGGLLGRKPTEYHVSHKALNDLFRQRFIEQFKPTLQQIVYCLGRHAESLEPEWQEAIEKYGAPPGVSQRDLKSEKWSSRFRTLQKADLFTDDKKANWKLIHDTTNGGKSLNRFVERLFLSSRYGLKNLKGRLRILTRDSTVENWWVASMTRLLYYYYASHRHQLKKQPPPELQSE